MTHYLKIKRRPTRLPVYVDIDGTLTDLPHGKWGSIVDRRLRVLRALIDRGQEIVLWTGGGTEYAAAFAKRHDFAPVACLGKPDLIVDDHPRIRPVDILRVITPEEFFG